MITVLVQNLTPGMVVAEARTFTRPVVASVEPSTLAGHTVVHFTNGRRWLMENGEPLTVVGGY